jgi:uncharacterized protein
MSTLAVIAKAPAPGVSKTRLSPPLTLEHAAALAEASLVDTLSAVLAAPAVRRVLVLAGRAGPWLPDGIEVVPQRGDGLAERLANAFSDLGGPTLIVGMDTPQLDPALLERGLSLLDERAAVLGPASDGGYWAIGLGHPERRALLGVPMSSSRTFAAQRRRLQALGLELAELCELRDVDVYGDALEVAEAAPATRFARVLGSIVALREAA